MFSTTDTIVAIATPPGRGGIGVVRLSGPDAHAIAQRLTGHAPFVPRHATFALVRCGSSDAVLTPSDSGPIDQVVVTSFPAPASYTGEDVLELSAHGSPVVLRAIVSAAVASGARLAEPGEFTLRAYLNGRVDLTQAEAVADLIDAVTPLQARAAFDQLQGTLTRAIGEIDRALFDLIARLEASIDFPDEGYHFVDPGALAKSIQQVVAQTEALLTQAVRGRLLREGFQVAIVGKPNVGKSSLFNALVGASRAIVTPIPGTTRDLVTETVDLEGFRVTLVDTAGLHETDDVVEREGVVRSQQAIGVADVILTVADVSQPLDDLDHEIILQIPDNKRLVVANKADLPPVWSRSDATSVSARDGDGVATLARLIAEALDVGEMSDRPAITNLRHAALVRRACEAMLRARAALLSHSEALSEEFVLADLQEARAAFEEVTGRRTPEDLLAHIFSRFCVGK